MFVILYSLLFIFIFIQSYNKFKKVINTVSIFSFVWCFFSAISSLGVTGYRVPKSKIHFYIIIFVFITAEIIISFSYKSKGNIYDSPNQQNDYVFHIPIRTFLLQYLIWFMLIPIAIKSLTILKSTNSLSEVRLAYFGGNFASPILDLLFRQMPMSMLQGMIILWTYYSFYTKSYKYLVLSALDTIIISFIAGGRYSIMLLLYSLIILGTDKINYIDIENSLWLKKIKKYAVLIVVFMIMLTANRGQAFFQSINGYYAGSISFLDYIDSNPNQFALNQKMNGYMTLGFVFEPIMMFLKILGLSTGKIPSYYFNIYCQNYYDVGDGTQTAMINANTSILYYYLRDFGFIGILIGAIFLGSTTVLFYNKWKKQGDPRFGMLYIY